MAESQGKDVSDVVTSGPGLVFIVYPEVVSQLPMPQIWAALFLVMFGLIGLDSEYCMVQGVISAIIDMFPKQLIPNRKLFVFCTCVIYMLCAMPMLTDGGMYLFQLFDAFSASGITLIFVVFCETMAIAWIY
ncbi:PREDICTED: sodium- and chloride-dependent GABA transporter 1-like, partial [Priapulus caudatus]|uniref:Sodium- and chloride-dependent GABA transporter 1-like n=1 Tax=Priapulus caudatus TaxID=37621 RepID=A0ABM1F7H3_PRICU